MTAYNSEYSGLQLDAAIAKHITLESQGGAVSVNILTNQLNNYLTKTDAAEIYAAKNSFINTNSAYGFVRAPTGGYNFNADNTTKTISTTITSHGRPIFIIVTGDLNPWESTGGWFQLIIKRGSTELCKQTCQSTGASINVPFSMSYLDITGAGEKTYSCTFQRGSGNFTLAESDAERPVLCVFEI